MDSTQLPAEPGRPTPPADVARALAVLATQEGVPVEQVWLAARAKVAATVSCVPELVEGADTWRALIARVGEPTLAAQVESAWRDSLRLELVDPERLGGYLLTALARLAGEPDAPHHRASLLGEQETAELVAAASGPVRPLPDRRFHELFEERVKRHPEAVAAVQGPRSWTYDEVNRRANRIAWALRAEGLQSEDVVAVVTERTLEWLVAVIAVFKAGGCYLPLEPRFPAGRVGAVLDRSACRHVLAEPGAAGLEQALADRPGVRLRLVGELLDAEGPEHDLGIAVSADQLAYIYFTSGSTGEPKGAMCEHGGFLNHLHAKIEDMGLAENGVLAQTAPQCFDISLWQLLAALLVGGRTVLVEQEVLLDVDRFIDTLDEQKVELAQLVPTYLDVFLTTFAERPRPLPSLRTMAVTGEALKKELTQRWFALFPDTPLVDCYGTTEASDDTNHGIMHAVPEQRAVPLGTVIRNIRVYVVDEWLRLVPRGAQGEIVFAGICVGRGYVNDPERTAAAYAYDPLYPEDRLYRTGDYGRLMPDGRLEYLGRRDSQVKISGFRIEIGEIENRLLQVPGVQDGAVVIARGAGEPQLVAYYTGNEAPDAGQVETQLGASLPFYMVPRRLYRVERLPLSDNGKINRRELTARAEAETGPAGVEIEPAATETERHVVRLWSQLLKVPEERIGRGSHFIELGGTSLAAIRLSNALDRAVTVGDLWRTSTVAEVAELIDRKQAERAAAR
jgi:amino acid adenylation domain-containing protein